jgi:micrococcal nuclease
MRKVSIISFGLAIIFLCGFASPPLNLFKVERVVDGDTIKLANGERVRYIGIDTPETKHPRKPVEYFGKEASAANKKLVEGKKVRLELDVQKRDRYGRLLAYVYVGDIFVNAWLVENGYAQVATYPPNVKYQKMFLKLQNEARASSKGLWQKK